MMATTIAPPEVKTPKSGGGGGFRGPSLDGHGEGGGPYGPASRESLLRLGIWVALAPIVMTFAAFTSSYIFRQGFASSWRAMQMPQLVWLNSAVLLLSSLTLELGKGALKADRLPRFKFWLAVTTVLGCGFVAGQLVVWRHLVEAGVYINTSPNSSFFYLLTGAHGLHLLGGIGALLYVGVGALRGRYWSMSRTAVDVTAVYWHFMDGLWVYLLLLLTLWR